MLHGITVRLPNASKECTCAWGRWAATIEARRWPIPSHSSKYCWAMKNHFLPAFCRECSLNCSWALSNAALFVLLGLDINSCWLRNTSLTILLPLSLMPFWLERSAISRPLRYALDVSQTTPMGVVPSFSIKKHRSSSQIQSWNIMSGNQKGFLKYNEHGRVIKQSLYTVPGIFHPWEEPVIAQS